MCERAALSTRISRELTGLAAIMRDVTRRFEEMRALKQKLAAVTNASQ
jgi:hypothetical protein